MPAESEPVENTVRPMLDPVADLERIRAPEGRGLFGSNDAGYSKTIFGRDSIETVEDILHLNPQVAREVIVTLAGQQGVGRDEVSEEEPGKIHHEWRNTLFGKEPQQWQVENWGGNEDEVCYYGTNDATPLFIRLVERYYQHDPNILEAAIERKDGRRHTIAESVREASQWIIDNIGRAGLVEYRSTNPYGLKHHGWRDTSTAVIHENGELPVSTHEHGKLKEFKYPVASLEIQGLAYDALQAAARLLETEGKPGADFFNEQARCVQRNVISGMWLPEKRFFAQAVDYDEVGEPRLVTTLSSTSGELLDSDLLRDLPEEQQQEFVSGIVTKLFSDEFLTDVGIRSRGLSHHEALPFLDYHGSWTTWPKCTYDIAKGLRRHGLPGLAEELERRLTNSFLISGGHYEFYYVNPEGEVLYWPVTRNQDPVHPQGVPGFNVAESGQAWSASAALAIQHREKGQLAAEGSWQRHLEDATLARIQPTESLIGLPETVERIREAHPPFVLDTERGHELHREFTRLPDDNPLP